MSSHYHIYWEDRPLFKNLDQEEFDFIWEKLMWCYSDELTYMKFDEESVESKELLEPSY